MSVSVDRAPADVYAFVSSPENLPLWATGLARAVRHVDGEWIADGPAGSVKLRFTARNDLGVLDHEVVPTSGAPVHVPMRVIPNVDGSEVVLTVFRGQAVSDDEFNRDVAWVRRDLETLKRLLER